MADWKTETYRGFKLEAFPAMLGWEIQAIRDGRHAFTFLTRATTANACLQCGRERVDRLLEAS